MKETWKPRDGNRYLVIPQGFTAMDIGCLDAFVALAEWKNIERLEQEQCANPSSLPQVPIPSRFFQRVLEMRATAPEMDMPVAGPMGHSCFISKLPPELHPAVTHVAQESAPSVGLDERVAVFCGDPRYLIMKEMTLLPFISRIFGGHVEPDHFVTASMRHSQDLESMVAWARLEHLRPHQVRLFFAEDFVLEPETAFRGLARFLGIDHACDVLPTIMHQLPQLCSKGLFQQCNGPEIEFIEHLTGRFEQELAKLPMDIQRSWQDQVSNLINLPNARLSTLGRLVAAHERWSYHDGGLLIVPSFANRAPLQLVVSAETESSVDSATLQTISAPIDRARKKGSAEIGEGRRWHELHHHLAFPVDSIDVWSPSWTTFRHLTHLTLGFKKQFSLLNFSNAFVLVHRNYMKLRVQHRFRFVAVAIFSTMKFAHSTRSCLSCLPGPGTWWARRVLITTRGENGEKLCCKWAPPSRTLKLCC